MSLGSTTLSRRAQGVFAVASDTYFTDDTGTGIVHQAPGTGENDYLWVCLAHHIISKVTRLFPTVFWAPP